MALQAVYCYLFHILELQYLLIVYTENNVDTYYGIELIDWYITSNTNAYSFAIGYAPKDDFIKFDRIPNVTVRIT